MIHVNYLVNLASADPEDPAKSIASTGELKRAGALGAEYLCASRQLPGPDAREGVAAVALGLQEAAAGLKRSTPWCCSKIQWLRTADRLRFAELPRHRDLAAGFTDLPSVLPGYPTCSAGYDIAREAGLRRTLEEAERTLDWPREGDSMPTIPRRRSPPA